MCGIFGVRGHADAAAADAPRAVLAAASRAGVGGHRRGRRARRRRARVRAHGTRLRRHRRIRARARCPATWHRPHALQHRRVVDDRERAAGARALPRRAHRARAQRQPHQRHASCGASSRTTARSSRRRWTPRCIVHRLARSRRDEARGASSPTRCAASRARTRLARGHRRHAARRARSARLAPARDRPARRRLRSFASETCALDIVGATFEREIEPRRDHRRRRERHAARAFRSRTRAASGASSSTCTSRAPTAGSSAAPSIARAARSAAGSRASIPRPDAELVFSVPDSSNSAALGYAEESGLPLELALIRNHYVGRTFIQPTQAGRDAKVKVKYNAVREVLDGQERRHGGRLDRPRHDDARARRAGARRRARARCTCASARRRSPARATTASTRRRARS